MARRVAWGYETPWVEGKDEANDEAKDEQPPTRAPEDKVDMRPVLLTMLSSCTVLENMYVAFMVCLEGREVYMWLGDSWLLCTLMIIAMVAPYIIIVTYLGPRIIARFSYISSAATVKEEAVRLVVEYQNEAKELIRDLRHQLLVDGKLDAEYLQKIFLQFDTDNSGEIDYIEFKAGCQELGVPFSEERMKRLLRVIDPQENGFVVIGHLVKMLIRHNEAGLNDEELGLVDMDLRPSTSRARLNTHETSDDHVEGAV